MTDAEQTRLAQDWADILRSEWAALAVDREVQEAVHRVAAHLARQAALLHAAPPLATQPGDAAVDAPRGPAGTAAPPRPAAFDAAPSDAGPASAASGPSGAIQPSGGAAGLG